MDETCAEMRPLLSGLVDGELDSATARRVETHLAACAGCRAALETLRAQDRMLRRAADAEDEKADPIAEDRALAGVLQRFREEPEAEWERAAVAAGAKAGRRVREAWLPRIWTVRLRWISGLAVAAAAVLLALRLSPYPLAPEAPRSVASKPAIESEPMAGGAAEQREDLASREAEQKAESPATGRASRIPVTPEMQEQAQPPASRSRANAAQGQDRAAKQEPPPAALAQKAADEAADAATAGEGAAPPWGAIAPEGAAPGVAGAEGARKEEEIPRAGTVAPGKDDLASAEEPAREEAREKKSPEPSPAPETSLSFRGGRASQTARQRDRRSAPSDLRSYTDALRSLAAPSGQVQSYDSASEEPFPAVADTAIAAITDWRERLDTAAARLERDAKAGLPPEEEAPRWTILGDLWDWLGRTENDPAAFARAVEAYQRALEIDARAAGVDPERLTRAVEGATVTSAPRE